MNQDDLLARAERAVERAVAAGAGEAECYAEHGRILSVEVEGGRLSVTSADDSVGIGLRVVVGGRVGFASASGLDAVVPTVERALRLAPHAPAKGYALPDPGPVTYAPAWDDAVAAMDAPRLVESGRGLLAAWRDEASGVRFPGGGVSLSAGCWAVASSRGVACADRQTLMSASASLVSDSDAPVSAWSTDTQSAWIADPGEVVRRAVDKVRRLQRPRPAPWSGPQDMLLVPDAAVELLSGFIGQAARGDEAMRGNTKWSGRVGETVASPGLSVLDDPMRVGAVAPAAFDGEGVPTGRRALVERGVLTGYLFDSWDAHEHGVATTASAVRDGFASRPSTGIHHFVVEHDRTMALERIVAGMDRGYLVDTLLGAHTANPTTGDYSVTAPNVWTVEKGEVTGPCREVAVAGSVGELLEGIAGVSSEVKRMDGATMPHVWTRGARFSA